MKVSKILAAVTAAAAVSSVLVATASAYNAYIGFQTNPYSFRNAWDDATYGAATPYFNSAIVWGSGDTPEETYPEYADNFDWDINGYTLPVEYTDAVVDADGTYTVSMDGFDWSCDGASGFNLIFVSTDIPTGSATVTSATVYVDGVAQVTIDNPVCEEKDNIHFNLANIWNTDVAAYTGAYPTDSLAVEFTVEGLGSADTGADAVVDTAAPTTGDKQSPDTGVEGVAAVAGLAVLAGGAMLISKKRK